MFMFDGKLGELRTSSGVQDVQCQYKGDYDWNMKINRQEYIYIMEQMDNVEFVRIQRRIRGDINV